MAMNLLVTGACRSGTSLAASYYDREGWDFGTRTEKRGRSGHRGVLGYYEDPVLTEIVDIHLASSGGWANGLPPTTVLPLDGPPLGSDVQQIRQYLVEDKEEPYGFKNCNIVYCFPWWHDKVFRDYTIVALFRHPAMMAASNHKMRYTPYEQSLALWKRTYQDLLLWNEVICDIRFVHFDAFSDDALWQAPSAEKPPLTPGYEYLEDLYEMLLERSVSPQLKPGDAA